MYNDTYKYKVEQLTAMRDYERKQAPDQQYGAQLNHWSGSAGKPIQLDADALQALIDHYYRLDSIERYQAAKQAAKADSDGNMTVAVNAAVKRFYRVYVEAPNDATTETIESIARRYILDASPEELEKQIDPDLDIEPQDIEGVDVDYDSIPALN